MSPEDTAWRARVALVALLTQSTLALVAAPIVGFAAAVVTTPASAGLLDVRRDTGPLLGPLLTGAAIERPAPALGTTRGHGARAQRLGAT